MSYDIVFKRIVSNGGPNDYILKTLAFPFVPVPDSIIDDGTGDDLEFINPVYCVNGVPNAYGSSVLRIDLKEIEESKVKEFLSLGWKRFVEPEPEEE